MENRRIFKLEFYNSTFKENAITYHKAGQKSWFLLAEGYMFSSWQCWWRYLKKCCENWSYLNKIEKIPMLTSNFSAIYLLHAKCSNTKRIHPFLNSEITEYKTKWCRNQSYLFAAISFFIQSCSRYQTYPIFKFLLRIFSQYVRLQSNI